MSCPDAYGFTRHARTKMRDIGLGVDDVRAVIDRADVIERYEDRDGKLLYGRVRGQEIHVSLVEDPSSGVRLVTTVYEVDRAEFPDGRTRGRDR